jgi:hypothetical protein
MPRGAKPGHPKWGGRPKGGKNKRTLAMEAAVRATVEGAKASDELPAEFLRRVAANESLDLSVRIAAATACAPYFSPKLSNVDLRAQSENVHFFIRDEPMTEQEWIAEFGSNIAGRQTPLATTVAGIHQIEVDVRNKRISQLEEEVSKLRDALLLAEARANEARKIPLLS